MCWKCSDSTGSAVDDIDMALDGDVVENLTKFLNLKDVLSTGGGVQEAVTARIRFEWKKLRDIAIVLCKRAVLLKMRRSLCKS